MLLFSCGNKNNNSNSQTDSRNDSLSVVNAIDSTSEDVNGLLNLFSKNKTAILKKLQTVSKEEANRLYEAYSKENQITLAEITASELDILDRFYHDDIESKNQIKELGESLKKHDLVFEELGEGYVEITTPPNFYDTIFSHYVTEDYKAYLSIIKEENKSLYSADAGLVISFRELDERIITWENFMEQYPNSPLVEQVKENYRFYQHDYLIGLDNTPTIERANPDSLYIYPENREEFSRFITKYPDSPTSKLVHFFLENFRSKNINDLITEE